MSVGLLQVDWRDKEVESSEAERAERGTEGRRGRRGDMVAVRRKH